MLFVRGTLKDLPSHTAPTVPLLVEVNDYIDRSMMPLVFGPPTGTILFEMTPLDLHLYTLVAERSPSQVSRV